MACLQPILNAACNTLEELYLTEVLVMWGIIYNQLSLASLVNLGNLSCLHVFALNALIDCDAQNPGVLRDINFVLSTIPTSNKVTSLTFDFAVSGERLCGCLEEDWVGLCDEFVCISGGKHLNLNLEVKLLSFIDIFSNPTPEEVELRWINRKIASLSEYPNICTQFKHSWI